MLDSLPATVGVVERDVTDHGQFIRKRNPKQIRRGANASHTTANLMHFIPLKRDER